MAYPAAWIFDLDNTLHNANHAIFPQINAAMTAYIAAQLQVDIPQAQALRAHYWQRYGATLEGLVRHHGVRAAHFLAQTHQLPRLATLMRAHPQLAKRLARLPGQKYVLSNGPRAYVKRVVRHLGLSRTVRAVWGVEDQGYRPKPALRSLRRLVRRLRLPPSRIIMVEDSTHNLHPARQLGLRTVWLSASNAPRPNWVDLQIRDLTQLHALPRTWVPKRIAKKEHA